MSFNRLRQEGTTPKAKESWFMLIQNPPEKLSPNGHAYRNLWDYSRIWDETPVGKFRPGSFKITSVEMCSLKHEATKIGGTIYSYRLGKPAQRAEGTYISPLTFTPFSSIPQPLTISYDAAEQLCQKALANANKPTAGIGELLAEMSSTVKMIANPMEGMRKLLHSCLFKRGGGWRSTSDAANAWLEARYGWGPLYSTVKELFSNFPTFKKFDLFDQRVSEKTLATTLSQPSDILISGTGIRARVQGSVRQETWLRGEVYMCIIDPNEFTRMKCGTSIFSAPALLWELTKLSFVLDWWWDFGSWISAAVPNPSVNVKGYTASHKTRRYSASQLDAWRLIDDPVGAYSPGSGYFTEDISLYRRDVFEPEVFALPLPDYGLNNFKHLFDGLSLIIQRIPKR